MERFAINTIPEAIAFLETMDLEVIGIWQGWIIHGTGEDNGDFELTCDTNAELIDYARYERDMAVWICAELGVNSLADISRGGSSSSETIAAPAQPESGKPIQTSEQAIEFLNSIGLVVAPVLTGWFVCLPEMPLGPVQMACNNDAELVAYARRQQHNASKLCGGQKDKSYSRTAKAEDLALTRSGQSDASLDEKLKEGTK